MANVSLVTGKTWNEMNAAEKLAHTLARGTTDASAAQDNPLYQQAQSILQQTGFADTQRQQALRDEAIDRIAAGQGQVGLQDAVKAAGYGSYQDYAQAGGQQQSSQGMLTQGPLVFGATGRTQPVTYGFQESPEPMFQSTDQYRQFEAVSRGGTRFNPDGTINKEWFNSLSPEEARQYFYDASTGGFGVGDNQIHRNMRSSLEEAYFERFPQQPHTGPLTFGGSAAEMEANAAAQEATQETTQTNQITQDQNFQQLLNQLGLASLLQAFTQNVQTPVQTATQTPVQQYGMLASPTFGVAPTQIGYVPQRVVPRDSATAQSGLLNYIMDV